MNLKLFSPLFLIFFIFLSFSDVSAQSRLRNARGIFNDERLSLTAGLGLSSYYGDLCDKAECMQFRPNIGIGAMLRMTNNIGIKGELNYFRLYSEDVWARRNLDFRSNNVELYVAGYVQLFPYQRYVHVRKSYNFYGFLGIGLFYFRPEGSLNGEWYPLRKLETEGVKYGPISAMIPFGGGFTYNITRNYEIVLELGYRKTFTDRLDDVSNKEWKLLGEFDDKTAAAISNKTGRGDDYWLKTGQYRGNPTKKDGYFISQVKVRYTFVSKRSLYRLRRAPLRKRF